MIPDLSLMHWVKPFVELRELLLSFRGWVSIDDFFRVFDYIIEHCNNYKNMSICLGGHVETVFDIHTQSFQFLNNKIAEINKQLIKKAELKYRGPVWCFKNNNKSLYEL